MSSVLIVDDDHDVRLMLRLRLGAPGRTVLAAPDAATALSLVAQHDPHVIVLDYRMPEVDGLELAARLQHVEHHGRVVLYTAHATRAVADRADALGLRMILKGELDRLCEFVDRSLASRSAA